MATFDARPIIAGGEWLNDIMTAVAALGQAEELEMLAPFDLPAQGVLGARAFACDAASLGDDR